VDAEKSRERLRRARLMLLFTPGLCGERDPLAVLEAALPHIDLVQVRIKAEGRVEGPSPARELHDWTLRVLDLCVEREVGVLVNDRVDVAAVLAGRGCAGVHLGQGDCPPEEARALLGPAPLIGLSTHCARDVAAAIELPVDYLGYGPIHATPTRGYSAGLGPEAAWVASEGSPVPVFPIGGIDASCAGELAPLGRAAVSSAILAAEDPGAAASEIALLLGA